MRPMRIMDTNLERRITLRVLDPIAHGEYDPAIKSLPQILDSLYAKIPENRRISYGRVHTIKVLSEHLFTKLTEQEMQPYQVGSQLFSLCTEQRSKGVALGILSYSGLINFNRVLPHFTDAAESPDWEIREFAQMLFRKITAKYPAKTQSFLLSLAKSKDARVRRFVAETLRPVQENQWIYSNPNYSLALLQHLFRETESYPRTAVGNNLSDLARRLPDLVYSLVEELVQSGDENSYWIAYRACRNLVKQDPHKVLNLLKIDEYRYKKRIYRRVDV